MSDGHYWALVGTLAAFLAAIWIVAALDKRGRK